MTFAVRLHASALAQLHGLPEQAFDQLVTCLADVSRHPWDTMGIHQAEPQFRQQTFGNAGLVSFYIDQQTEQLWVFDITWAG